MNLKEQIISDAKALQAQLQRLQIGASIDPKRCTPGGDQLAFFGLKLHGKTTAADVAKALPELMRAISQSRRKRTHLRLDDIMLRLEAEHPARKPLQWLPSIMRRCKPHSAALGISHHDGEQVVSVSFEDIPQILVAGETGSGKTVLMRNLIASLAYATPPDELKMVLVDPKNEDLRPYARLPHVVRFAGTQDAVAAALDYVAAEVQARIADPSRKPYRLLLIVDELAQLMQINGAIKTLGNIMSIGRSKLINCVVATQSPTEEGGAGSMMKANVPLRLIGAVSAGQSYTATRRKNAGADMLPGNGAFLFIKGLELYRFQSYFMDSQDERHAVAMVGQKWDAPVQAPTELLPEVAPPCTTHAPVLAPPVAPIECQFPLSEKRALTDQEAAAVRRLAADGMSKNWLCTHVYGAKSARYMEWINAALGGDDDGKVIKLRRSA